MLRTYIFFLYQDAVDHSAEWHLVYWTAALTIATFLLFVVAAFQENIKNWFFKPKLYIEIELSPPDCHRATSVQQLFNNMGTLSYYVYYFRFKIWNKGNISAKNVEVILKGCKEK